MTLAQVLTRVLIGASVRGEVKTAGKGEAVLLATGVKLFGRKGKLVLVLEDSPDAGL